MQVTTKEALDKFSKFFDKNELSNITLEECEVMIAERRERLLLIQNQQDSTLFANSCLQINSALSGEDFSEYISANTDTYCNHTKVIEGITLQIEALQFLSICLRNDKDKIAEQKNL